MANLLPSRPFQVRSGFTLRIWLFAVGLVFIAVAAAPFIVRWRIAAAGALVEEKRIWEEGVPVKVVSADWKLDAGVVFDDYRIDLRYFDTSGNAHHEKAEITTLRRLDVDSPVQVRCVPDGRYALSAVVERLGDRWIAWYAATAAAASLTLGLVFLAGLKLRHWLDVRHAADRSDEIELTIERIEQVTWASHDSVTKTQRFRYHCRLDLGGGQLVLCDVVFNAALGEYPLFANDEQSRLVALVSPHARRRPIIPRNDMYPFKLDPQQIKTIKARLALPD